MTTPDPSGPATTLAYGVGGQVVDLAVALAPVVVPFVLALAGIYWVMSRCGLLDIIELASLERAEAEQERVRHARAVRREERKAARWDAMLDDAYAENRRRTLRRKIGRG